MKIKYPRTMHLPFSPGATSDDKILSDTNHFQDKEVIVTEKFDGENTTLYKEYLHARSLDSAHHPSRNWVKQFHASIKNDIPDGWRICGENLYAKHSILYEDLPSYFLGFSIWDDNNNCLGWDETLEWFKLLGITPVTLLYEGLFLDSIISYLWDNKNNWPGSHPEKEGCVVRIADKFHYTEFSDSVAKFVRKNHIQTSEHWMTEAIIPNKLKG